MIILVKLLLAHLIGDFLLQPKSWVAEKEKKNGKLSVSYWLLSQFLGLGISGSQRTEN